MYTPIIGNTAQLLPYTPNRHPDPLQLCQQITPITDTPESPTPESRGQSDIFRPYDLPNPSTSTSFNNPLNLSAVSDGLQNLALHPHPARNEWVTGCLVCGQSFDQVIRKLLPITSTRQRRHERQYENVKSNKMFSLMVLRVEYPLFSPQECRRLSPVTTCSTPSMTMDKTQACRDMHCPYSKIKLTKLSLNKLLAYFSPPPIIFIK